MCPVISTLCDPIDCLLSFHDNNDGDDGGGDGGDVVMTTVRRWERGEGDGRGDDGEMAGVLMVLRLTRHTPGIGSTGEGVVGTRCPGRAASGTGGDGWW